MEKLADAKALAYCNDHISPKKILSEKKQSGKDVLLLFICPNGLKNQLYGSIIFLMTDGLIH